MAKGKFSKSRSRDEGAPEEQHHFHRSEDMEETTALPEFPLEDSPRPENDDFSDGIFTEKEEENEFINISMMPEVDFHNLTGEDLSDLSLDEIPEFDSLELNQDAPPLPHREKPSEEEAIEEAFQQAVADKSRPRKSRKPSVPHPRRRKGILIGSSVAAGILILALALAFLIPQISDPYDHRILDGVTVLGTDIGSMTRDEAVQFLNDTVVPQLSSSDFTLVLPEETITLTSSQTAVTFDSESAVKEAYRYGRSGSKADKETAYRNSLTEKWILDPLPFLKMNESYVKGQLKTYTLEHESLLTPSSYALEGEQPPLDLDNFNENNTCQSLLLNPGTPGIELDFDKICRQILTAYGSLQMKLSITAEQTGTLPEALDLYKIKEEISIDPVNSSLDMETFEVISGSYGYTFDMETAQKLLKGTNFGETARVPMIYVAPDIMDDGVLFRDVLGEAVTPHGNNANRNTNLKLACEALDGVILLPGDELSYNETLGQRTAEKGYRPAPAYSGNTLVDSIGGGICQVSSTLYYAAMLADLEITDRINHGFLPTYIDPGMDATVSWGKPDFKFRNSRPFPIKIKAEATDDSVKVQILGTDDSNYYVKMEYTDSVTKAGVTYKNYSPGEGYSDGDVIQGGNNGHYVITYRCKYDKQTDELISRDQEARSSYPAHDRIVAVVKEAEKPEPHQPELPTPPAAEPVTPTTPEAPPSAEQPTEPPATNSPEVVPPAQPDLPEADANELPPETQQQESAA